MAQLKGSIQFTGSLGNIRSYYSRQLKRFILATKGGASRELIMNNPNFARTRENMNEFKVCGYWSSQLRRSLPAISHLHQGYYFSEIVAMAKVIQKHDEAGVRGFRPIESSKSAHQLPQINFNRLHPFEKVLSKGFSIQFSDDKRTVTLSMPGFKPFSHLSWPMRYQSFRIVLVIAQLPDWVWNDLVKEYQPKYKEMEGLSVSAFTDWLPEGTQVNDILLSASFAQPALQQPGTTVIVAMGIEVMSAAMNAGSPNPTGIGTMKIVECFV